MQSWPRNGLFWWPTRGRNRRIPALPNRWTTHGSIPYKTACIDLLCVWHPRIPRAVSLISLGFANVYHGGIGQAAQVCSNGLAGVETADVCCVAECGTCGGAGCGRRAQAFGLTAANFCAGRIRDADVFYVESEAAPCIIGGGEWIRQRWVDIDLFHRKRDYSY